MLLTPLRRIPHLFWTILFYWRFWEGTHSHGKFCPVQFNSVTACPVKDFPLLLGRLDLRLKGLMGCVWVRSCSGSRLPPPPAKPNSSCFGGRERGWDVLTVLCLFHCFCCFSAVTQVIVETLCWAYIWVLALSGTCVGSLGSLTGDIWLWLSAFSPLSYFTTWSAVPALPAFPHLAGRCLIPPGSGGWKKILQEEFCYCLVSPKKVSGGYSVCNVKHHPFPQLWSLGTSSQTK